MDSSLLKEKELIKLILRGNVKLFEEIIKQYQRLVLSIVIQFVNDKFDREDVCQEIFIKVYQNLAGFNFNSKLSTWIGKITYNHCINYVNKNSRFLTMQSIDEIKKNDTDYYIEDFFCDSYNTISEDYESKEIHKLLKNYIGKLPKLYQTILNLYHIQEMSYKEISEILSLPEGTVKSYLFRSRKKLKEKLLSSYKEEEFV